MVEKTVEKNLRAYLQKPDSSGLARVYIVFNNKGKQWIKTGIKVLPENWDQTSQYIKSGQTLYKKLNAKLAEKKVEIAQAIEALGKMKIEATTETVTEYMKPKAVVEVVKVDRPTISELLKAFVKQNTGRLTFNYLRKFTTIARSFDAYKPGLMADDLTRDELTEWIVTHLLEECEIENNTISDYVTRIKRVMDIALRKGQIKTTEFIEFNYRYIKPKPFWLDWKEVEMIEAYSPKSLYDRVYKDEFLFRCYTGLRWSDSHQLRPEHFIKKNGSVFYDFNVVKTSLSQNIEMIPKAVAILDGWGYRIPKLYLHECNSHIKDIAEGAGIKGTVERVRFRGSEREINLLPRHKMVTTHVARRTFARRWMDLGGEIGKLSKYLGHSSIEQTSDYVGYTTKEVNDELRKLMG